METPKLIQEFIDYFSKKHGLNIKIKSKSNPDFLLKAAALIAGIFNKRFMSSYITTILGTIWVPNIFFNRIPKYSLDVIAHEIVHEYDRKRLGTILFGLLYFSPQIFAIFALLAFIGGSWVWCLLFIFCLAPLPSLGRMWIELRGYRTNLMFEKYVYGSSKKNRLEQAEQWMQKKFTGSDYYFMWPFKKWIIKQLMAEEMYEDERIYKEIRTWLKIKNLLIVK